MKVLWLYRLLGGYLGIEIKGEGTERVLSRCALGGILLWNSKRRGDRVLCRVSVGDFRHMRRATSHCGVRVHIQAKRGMPFLIGRYRKRPGIPVGAALFFAVIIFLSGFVWSVEPVGNERIESREIIKACKELGLACGTPKSAVNPGSAKQELMLKLDGISWCAFNLEGCGLTVEISETEPTKNENDIPCDLKAGADGIVTQINVTAGKCLVRVGDTVRKGQLLVSGVEEKNGTAVFVRAAGSITAVTEREITVTADYRRQVAQRNGRVCKKRVLSVFGVKIPLYVGAVTGEYESEEYSRSASLFGKNLPITLYGKKFYFTDLKETVLSREALEEELIRAAGEKATVEISGDYEVKNREFDEIEGGLSLKTLISAETDVAIQDIILFYAGNS